MTSASELFCSRRSRGVSDWSYSQHYLRNFDGQRSDRIFGIDSHHRINTRPLLSKMPGCQSGQEQTEAEEVIRGAGVSSIRNRPSVTCGESERLPGSVLQAKERLLRRLRGDAVSDRSASAINVNQRNYASNINFHLVDGVDWESDIAPELSHSESDPFYLAHSEKPCRLSQEAGICLPSEIFKSTNRSNESKAISWDCSICLERFSIGNKLTRLPCHHRFHQDCLRQWIQIRGDCPCCRSNVF